MNAKTEIHSAKPSDLTRVLRDITGNSTDVTYPLELGPGIVYVVELPSRKLRYLTSGGNGFPKSFYSLASEAERWDEMVLESSQKKFAETWSDPFNKEEIRYKIQTSRRGGNKPVCEYRAPLLDKNNNLVGALCRIVDDSFRSMAMDALVRRSWKEIATTMTRRFLHDFNNTIAGIYSLSELYSEPGSDPQSMTEAMEHIRNSSIRSQEITKKIRQLTTLEDGEPSYFNLEKLVQEQDEYIQALLPKEANIVYQLSGKEIPVYLDANQFRQAILHLASNAKDAATGEIEIRIQVVLPADSGREKMARIDFFDNGSGISDENIFQVLVPFFTTKDIAKHPGLGLNIVKSFVEKFGGLIEVKRVKEGTVVSLYIPVLDTDSKPEQEAEPEKAAVKISKPQEPARPLNLLVYTWEDITRHPLLLSMKDAEWNFRVHLDPGQLLIELAQPNNGIDGVVVFKSALDEKVEPLISELGFARNCPKISLIALGESVDSIPDSVKRDCGLIASGASKPTALLNKLAKYYQ